MGQLEACRRVALSPSLSLHLSRNLLSWQMAREVNSSRGNISSQAASSSLRCPVGHSCPLSTAKIQKSIAKSVTLANPCQKERRHLAVYNKPESDIKRKAKGEAKGEAEATLTEAHGLTYQAGCSGTEENSNWVWQTKEQAKT